MTDLRLSEEDRTLVAETVGRGVPTVVVVIGGRAHSLEDVAGKANALVMAWLPGEEGGSGLADVLCGDIDAGGRLPVSLLRSVGQVGLHSGHHHGGGRSMFLTDYVDAPASPLFPFGHGLSYTSWRYSELSVDSGSTSDEIVVTVTVTNVGARPGEEVVQVYARDEVASVGVPAKRLVGFHRIAADAGVATVLAFTIPAGRLGFHDGSMRFVVEPGDVTFTVGTETLTVTLEGDPWACDPNQVPAFSVTTTVTG